MPLLLEVHRVDTGEILGLRECYRAEMNCQIIHYSWLARGWYDAYLLSASGENVGYGCVGGIRGANKFTAMEFYVKPEHRGKSQSLFRAFIDASGATRIECQTNDRLLTLMLYDTASRIKAGPVLFEDSAETHHFVEGAIFRKRSDADLGHGFPADLDADAEYVIEADGRVVAAGGVLYHYNPPFGDIYMAVSEPFRRRGYGAYLVQELKRACREAGKVPAARCNAANAASRATLQKAGLTPCGRLLTGTVKR